MEPKAYGIGFAVGVMIVAIVCVIIRKVLKRKTSIFSNEYDERQKAIQGRGYKMAYMTSLVLLALQAVLSTVWESFPLNLLECALICIWIPLCVFVTYCIFKDAYLSLRSNRRALVVLWLAAGLFNIAIAVYYIAFKSGEGMWCMNLLTGAALLYLCAVMGVKVLAERKAGDE